MSFHLFNPTILIRQIDHALALALLSNPAVNRRQEIRCICLLSITTHFQFRNCKASRNNEQDRNDRNGQRVEPETDENSISFQLKPTC